MKITFCHSIINIEKNSKIEIFIVRSFAPGTLTNPINATFQLQGRYKSN